MEAGVDDYEKTFVTVLENTLSEAVNAIFEAKPKDPIAFLQQHLAQLDPPSMAPSRTVPLAPPTPAAPLAAPPINSGSLAPPPIATRRAATH